MGGCVNSINGNYQRNTFWSISSTTSAIKTVWVAPSPCSNVKSQTKPWRFNWQVPRGGRISRKIRGPSRRDPPCFTAYSYCSLQTCFLLSLTTEETGGSVYCQSAMSSRWLRWHMAFSSRQAGYRKTYEVTWRCCQLDFPLHILPPWQVRFLVYKSCCFRYMQN